MQRNAKRCKKYVFPMKVFLDFLFDHRKYHFWCLLVCEKKLFFFAVWKLKWSNGVGDVYLPHTMSKHAKNSMKKLKWLKVENFQDCFTVPPYPLRPALTNENFRKRKGGVPFLQIFGYRVSKTPKMDSSCLLDCWWQSKAISNICKFWGWSLAQS